MLPCNCQAAAGGDIHVRMFLSANPLYGSLLNQVHLSCRESFGSARDNVDIDYSFDTTDFSKWKFS